MNNQEAIVKCFEAASYAIMVWAFCRYVVGSKD